MILSVILLALLSCAPDVDTADSAGNPAGRYPCELCDGLCYETWEPNVSRNHVTGDVAYEQEPPTSGDHNACWATWGAHTEEVPAENWVHNMEHGGVVFLYDCPGGTCPDEVAELTAYGETLPEGRWVLSPYAPAPLLYTVVSWEYELELGCFSLDSLSAFFDLHVGHGPENATSSPSSSCM